MYLFSIINKSITTHNGLMTEIKIVKKIPTQTIMVLSNHLPLKRLLLATIGKNMSYENGKQYPKINETRLKKSLTITYVNC